MTIYMQPKQILLFTISTFLFLGCSKQESVKTAQSMETLEQVVTVVSKKITPAKRVSSLDSSTNESEYGEYQEEIETMLSVAPVGSEIYIEQRDGGDWYLKIEKTFTAQKNKEKEDESLYGETILI